MSNNHHKNNYQIYLFTSSSFGGSSSALAVATVVDVVVVEVADVAVAVLFPFLPNVFNDVALRASAYPIIPIMAEQNETEKQKFP